MTTDPHTTAILAANGFEGLAVEAKALLRRMSTASSLYRDGVVKGILATGDEVADKVAGAIRNRDVGTLSDLVDDMRNRIRTARRAANPDGLAALVLHADEAEWTLHASLNAYLRASTPSAATPPRSSDDLAPKNGAA